MIPLLVYRTSSAVSTNASSVASGYAENPSTLPDQFKYENCEIENIFKGGYTNHFYSLANGTSKCFYGSYIIAGNASYGIESKTIRIFKENDHVKKDIVSTRSFQNAVAVIAANSTNADVAYNFALYSPVVSKVTCSEDCLLQVVKIPNPISYTTDSKNTKEIKVFIIIDHAPPDVLEQKYQFSTENKSFSFENLVAVYSKSRKPSISATSQITAKMTVDGSDSTQDGNVIAVKVNYDDLLKTDPSDDKNETINYSTEESTKTAISLFKAGLGTVTDNGASLLTLNGLGWVGTGTSYTILDSGDQGKDIAIAVSATLGAVSLVLLLALVCQCKKKC